jgi:diphthamide biosynthesis protein 4
LLPEAEDLFYKVQRMKDFPTSQPRYVAKMPHQMVTSSSTAPHTSYYEILGLQVTHRAGNELLAQQLKAAYRRALLQHHPDKSHVKAVEHISLPSSTGGLSNYTVDQISEAYAVLSVPKLRSEYDRELKLHSSLKSSGQQNEQLFRTGFETVDLDDLDYDEDEAVWYRSCRCGDQRGFLVREADLEEASEEGEVHVGCRGCSLWLRVLFGVVEDDVVDKTADEHRKG